MLTVCVYLAAPSLQTCSMRIGTAQQQLAVLTERHRRHERVPASHTFATRLTTSSARLPLTIDDHEVNSGDEERMYLI